MSGLLQHIELSGADLPRLEALRQKGRAAFETCGLPTAKTEAWKYTRVRVLENADFVIGSDQGNSTCCCEHDGCHHQELPFPAYEIHFCNGRLTDDHFNLSDGLEVMNLLDAVRDAECTDYLNKSFELTLYPFAALNSAYLEQGVFVRIAQQTVLDKPLALIYHTQGGIKRLSNIRNLIVLENGAKAQLLEYYHYSGEQKSEYFNNIVNEIYIGRQAFLGHYKVQDEAFKAVHIANNFVRVKAESRYEALCLQKGADLARHETHVCLREEKASAVVNAVYLMNGWATIDTTTDMEHLAPDTCSSQLVKGVIGGQAKGVFQGKIHIAPKAVKTQGYQLHKALLLSNEAEVDVKPELEIYADDVKCSHGAASGDLDAEQMFYLRSRGIAEEEAQKLLIRAFAEEPFDLSGPADLLNRMKEFL